MQKSPLRVLTAVVLGALAGGVAMVSAAEVKAKPEASRGGFELGKVYQVHITVSAKEYAAMQPRSTWTFGGFGTPPKPAPPEKPEDPPREVHRNTFGMNLPWATGSVTVDGETFREVGVRYKGNGTIADAARSTKKSFKIDLDRFGGAGRFLGSKSINLHCGAADPSKCRDTLGYGLYRAAGVPASRTVLSEVRITVPGKHDNELLGLYTIVESVDKPFLRDHFGTDKGLLMKPEGLRELEYRGDNWDLYKKQYIPKDDATPAEAKRVIAFARLVHKADDAEFRKEIASYLDIDAFLRYLATTSFVANVDSFFILGHNYYLYLHPKTRQFHFLPWDLDRAFANLPIIGTNNQQMNLSLTHPYGGAHRLTDRLMAMPEVSVKYQKLLKELAATAFAKERLLKELEAAEASMKELLARDTQAAAARKESGPPIIFGIKPPPLRTFIEKRTASVAAQLEGRSKGHIPSGGFGGPGAFKIGEMLAGPMMEELDSGKDEKLSKDEWVAAAKRVFAASEKGSQGWVNEKGLTEGLNGLFPKPPEGAPPGPSLGSFMAPLIVKRADADKDGKVTLDELLGAANKIFAEFDKEKAANLDETAFGELLTALFPTPQFGQPPPRPAEPKKDEPKPEKKP